MNLQTNSFLQGGKYKIEQVLGQGGFGITYVGVQVVLNRKVAIKEFFMKEYCERDSSTSHVTVPSSGRRELVERFRKKFVKEAQMIAGFNHPNIIRIHDIFEENGTAYYVMEYHAQGSLSDLLKAKGKLTEKQGVDYVRQVAAALRYVHGNYVNHLDIKPGNILIGENDEAVLIDFGTSKRYEEDGKLKETSTTPVGISHGYAPSEQYWPGGVSKFSPQTDIYALGATLYKLVTGDTPPAAGEVDEHGLTGFPDSLSRSLRDFIVHAMQPKRIDRPQTVDEFIELLSKVELKKDDDDPTIIDIDNIVKPDDKNKRKKEPTTIPLDKLEKKSFSFLATLKRVWAFFSDYKGRTSRTSFWVNCIWLVPLCFFILLCMYENPMMEFREFMNDYFGLRYFDINNSGEYHFINAIWHILPLSIILLLTLPFEVRRLNDCGGSRIWAYLFNLILLVVLIFAPLYWYSDFNPDFIRYSIWFPLLLSLFITIRYFIFGKSK